MNKDNQTLTKKGFEESIKVLQETLVGGMNQMLTTLIDHMDKRFEAVDARFEQVDSRFDRIEMKLENTTDDLTQRVSKLEKQRA